MNVLLDTHLMLWFAQGDARFPECLLPIVENPANGVFVSEVSALEVAIKHAKNPVAMPLMAEDFVELSWEGCLVVRPLTREAIFVYDSLDLDRVGELHKDPFDRLLICQAKTEGLILATNDMLLALYGEPCVRVFI